MCRHDCFWNCSTPGAVSDSDLSKIGDPIPIEKILIKLMTKTTQISQMIQYLKNQITRNTRLNEHERPDLLDHIVPNQNRTSQNLSNRNKATTRLQQYDADRYTRDQRTIDRKMKKSTHTKPDLPSFRKSGTKCKQCG